MKLWMKCIEKSQYYLGLGEGILGTDLNRPASITFRTHKPYFHKRSADISENCRSITELLITNGNTTSSYNKEEVVARSLSILAPEKRSATMLFLMKRKVGMAMTW